MLRFGEYPDEENEVKLYGIGRTTHSERLSKSGLDIYFRLLQLNVNPRLGITSKFLFPKDKDYTFRSYGKMKDFTWYDKEILVTTRSHLEYIRNSPKLSVDYVDNEVLKGRVYGLELYDWEYSDNRLSLVSGTLQLVRFDNIKNYVYLSRYDEKEPVSDIQRFLDMIAEADVIALNAKVDRNVNYSHDFVLLVYDDQTKIFLDKLMTIYREDGRMREYLGEYNITLGMVLDNVDLYHCLSFGL